MYVIKWLYVRYGYLYLDRSDHSCPNGGVGEEAVHPGTEQTDPFVQHKEVVEPFGD